MAEHHENRRVRMTKSLMKDALLELMEHQDLINISVTAICETADVHRSTFYKYYSDPSELLREIEQDFLDRIPTPPKVLDQQNQQALLQATSKFFDFIMENKKTFRVLFSGSSGSSFASRLVEFLCDGYVLIGDETDEITSRFKSIYIANGTVGMMREWVNADFPVSSQKIAEMMYFYSKKLSLY